MEMEFRKKNLEGLCEIVCEPFTDERGFLGRAFDTEKFRDNGIDVTWTEQSISYTARKDTVRGLYSQMPPHTERKLISVVMGRMFWVTIDIRKNSPTFGHWESTVLSPDGINGLFVESGFAHGCMSLTDDCYLILNAEGYFSPDHAVGIIWNDKDLAIEWPLDGREPLVSQGHSEFGTFAEFKKQYGGI